MKIKCTYEDCFRHFESQSSMITHKIKDIKHCYCKLCDLDFPDDMHLFIHQLGTPAHICCPVCALEFKSIAGRDRHVEQSLMQHIENDECDVIRLRDFQMQRAEKQLQKDTWMKETEPYDFTSPVQSRLADAASLMDDEAAGDADGGVSLVQPRDGRRISTLPEQHFPPSGTDPTRGQGTTAKSQLTTSNLLKNNDPTKDMAGLTLSHHHQLRPQAPAWDSYAAAAAVPEPTPGENAANIRDWLGSVNSKTNPPSDNHSEVASIYDRKSPESVVSENYIPQSLRAGSIPAGGIRRVITMPAHSIITSTGGIEFEKYWDSLRQEYVCPGEKCLRAFKGQLDFKNHLLSAAHVGGQVTCPSCLKKFATTTAWVAHCESASKRCDIRKSADFNNVMREITGGILGTSGFLGDGSVRYVAPRIEEW
ncbi:hypothetical protein H2204_004073 [Knufia peltigerae]|uniref:C2H2-type domain-containing protein n=1 Tax=Knufia peltigerae TaxID=1002370 RepID=A0AA38Y8C5_9EURO|nr:hypothetical protein H2204_004073 [Knufia peltigerae]